MTRRLVLATLLALGLAACSESDGAAKSIWKPRPGLSWQIQLQGKVDTSVKAAVFEIDGDESPKSLVDTLHRRKRKVICYFSAGTYENFRADRDTIPPEVRGKPLGDFPDEQWLDIRELDKLAPMIESRLNVCRAKGFDAVDFDNVDGYTNDTGFPLTAADQLRFNRYLAAEAHERGLAAGLKNDLDQIPQLVGNFEFQVNEQCFEYRECDRLRPFIARRKAVFTIEYRRRPSQFCKQARRLGFSSIYKRLSLKSFRIAC